MRRTEQKLFFDPGQCVATTPVGCSDSPGTPLAPCDVTFERHQKRVRKPNPIERGVLTCLPSTPRLAGLLRSNVGSGCWPWLRTLVEIAGNFMLKRSVMCTFFLICRSRFQKGMPRTGREPPVSPSSPRIGLQNSAVPNLVGRAAHAADCNWICLPKGPKGRTYKNATRTYIRALSDFTPVNSSSFRRLPATSSFPCRGPRTVEGSIAQLESLEIAYIGATLRGPPRAFVERPVPSGTACHCQPASRLCLFTRSYIFHQLSHGVSLDPSQVCLGFR